MLGGSDKKEFVVVKYYAHYCKICQRAGMQFKKIATEYPDISFGKVESMVLPDSANTLRSLGVSKFPFVQIYRKGQCVASFSTGPSHLFVKKVRDTIDSCLKRSPEEWNAFLSEFSSEIESNRQARETLLLPWQGRFLPFFEKTWWRKGWIEILGTAKPVESTGVQAKKYNQPWGTNPSIYAPPTRWNLPRLYIYSQFAFCNQQENLSYAFPPSAHLFTSRRKIFPFFRNPLWSLTPKLSR